MTGHILESMNEVISNDYSYSHQAVDIVGAGGSIDDVIAFADGVVEIVVKDVKYTNHNTVGTDTYGNFVKIRHDDGTKTLYAHLKYGTVIVENGQRVSKGEKIGTMGETGNAYGVHLHFEVRKSDETRMDPKEFLYKAVENTNVSYTEKSEESGVLNENIKKSENETNEEVIYNEEDAEKNDNNEPEKINENQNILEEDNTIDDVFVKEIKQEVLRTFYHKSDNVVGFDLKIDTNTYYLSNDNYQGGSIVDALKEIGIDSSFDNRELLALKNGIDDYKGTYDQNVLLLSLLVQGKLKA